MRNYFILISVLALTACASGGSGGGAGGAVPHSVGVRYAYSTPSEIRSANAAVTGMETFTNSANEIVARVLAAGIKLSEGSSISHAYRSGSVSDETLADAYKFSATNVQKRAMEEFKNMYKIANNTEGYTPTDQQLFNAYILAGNNADSYDVKNLSDENRAAMRSALEGAKSTINDDVASLIVMNGDDWYAKTDTLENVNFKVSGEDSYITFTLNNKGIIEGAVKHTAGSDDKEFNNRIDNGNSFDDGNNTKLSINSENLGLKYADFGFAEISEQKNEVTETTFMPYVGGHDSRKFDDSLNETVKFKGIAIAAVDSSETHNETENKNSMLVSDKTAELTMNKDGTTKLVMNNFIGVDADHVGQKWYKMTVETTNPDVAHGHPKFTIENVDGVNETFAMKTFDENSKIIVDFSESSWDTNKHVINESNPRNIDINGNEESVKVGYTGMTEATAYGPSAKNPSEATSRFEFSEKLNWNDNADHSSVAIYGAFGGKKTNY